ncbi:nucleoside deaminase [Robertkochia aurantiaca]|uniref:nucleoside deaminase n=1 Tax=Robertkochia aurantiaca TaxID=2873700 RepID=UPI001CCEFE6D|nr:deaminase [Robertkochia sp. 3YJGBD-33]
MNHHNYQSYLSEAQKLARKAAAAGEVAAGCVIIRNDNIIAKGEEATLRKKDITAHAEIEAIREAVSVVGKDLKGAVLVTTKEPCVMCSYAIRYHGISTVVFEVPSEHFGGATSSFNLLTTKQAPHSWPPPVQIVQYNPE